MSLAQDLNEKALTLVVPLSAHVDLTYRCNERCVHFGTTTGSTNGTSNLPLVSSNSSALLPFAFQVFLTYQRRWRRFSVGH